MFVTILVVLLSASVGFAGEQVPTIALAVPARQNRLIWVTVKVPADTKPGDYLGKVRISISGVKHWRRR